MESGRASDAESGGVIMAYADPPAPFPCACLRAWPSDITVTTIDGDDVDEVCKGPDQSYSESCSA